MNPNNKQVLAVIWDFDGTLVDTSTKNLNVTRNILQHIKPEKNPLELPALKDLPSYIEASLKSVNWRDFYVKEFCLTAEETDLAGKLWTEFQLKDDTEISFFPGIIEVIKNLKDIPHGIVSQNSRENILKLLKKAGLNEYFRKVIGYEEVSLQQQKPHPDGLLKCIEGISDNEAGVVYYIGDHETDIACAFHANEELDEVIVRSIAAFYSVSQHLEDWEFKPDHTALEESDILEIIPHV